jgi:hypothetical protein
MNNVKQNLLDEAGKIVNGARRKDYGTPEDNFARIAKFWQAYMENTGRPDAKITPADVSPMMRLMKEARLCESPDHRDSFVDIIGYTLTGAEINLDEEPSHEGWASDLTDTPTEAALLDDLVDKGIEQGWGKKTNREVVDFLDTENARMCAEEYVKREDSRREDEKNYYLRQAMALHHLGETAEKNGLKPTPMFNKDWPGNVDGGL